MFVVAGVSGHTGAVVAETLLDRGQPVRVFVRTAEKGRTWTARGAEMAVGSLDDAAAVAAALAHAQGAYLLLPPNHQAGAYLQEQARIIDAMAAGIRAAAVPHVVFLSSIGAQLPAGTGVIRALHEAEKTLRGAVEHLTLLRAPYFMENWLPAVGEAMAHGRLPTFLTPSHRIPMIASQDIGSIAAACLMDRPRGVRVLELSGPKEYSPADVARTLTRRLGRTVTAQHAPLSAIVPALMALGVSPDAARLYEEMYEAVEHGRVVFEDDGCCRPRGLITLEEWVARQVDATRVRTA